MFLLNVQLVDQNNHHVLPSEEQICPLMVWEH